MGVFGFPGFSHWVPEVRGPAREGIREAFGPIGAGHL
jgi:hypothetical protein